MTLLVPISAAAEPVCSGASLLQASSHRIAGSSPTVHKFTEVATFFASWHAPVAILILVASIVCLVVCALHRDQPSHRDPTQSRLLAKQDTELYDDVEEYETDAGDWQIDDIVGETIGAAFGGKEERHHEESEEYDPDGVTLHIKETYGSWRLLRQIVGALMQFWAAIAFMYWSLLYREEELMNCTAYPRDRPNSFFVRHACYYTFACLRGFPILSANVVLVLMIRILVQTRFYYSMLKTKYVLDFANSPVMRTIWPWSCGISMFQGGLHFVLKAVYAPDQPLSVEGLTLLRKFVLPGTIFFSFLLRYADIENTLVPLNRIAEQDYTKTQRNCPWLSQLTVLNERVLAFDTRHRDVVGATASSIGKSPTIDDIIANIIANYDDAHKIWLRRHHHNWGLFKSMWPASVLLDSRLDRKDPETNSWFTVFEICGSSCLMASALSLYILFACTSDQAWHGFFTLIKFALAGNFGSIESEMVLANMMLMWHAVMIVLFVYRSVFNMFYFSVFKPWQQHGGLIHHMSSGHL